MKLTHKHKFLVLILGMLCFSNPLLANDWGEEGTGSEGVFIQNWDGTYRFNKYNPTVKKEGYYTIRRQTIPRSCIR